ncbi:thiopeptide-type bacteriocin biosynthesis protein [Flavobacterium hungaricum]|uniref:Thiopeptide-type bacteriocin biosynthesis domain-containing protein n=1 Tax=Flavobacterium hungaricum TaxID=2082725 RepID=A0ABR9TGT9_9FLAO|nr:thiopeptide-type bacteriocin biosynthesis protein [Flavobacterium hungaricum]MBE8724578.1 hypothetical protein [Flavobacterium hungaricum]
MQRNFCLGSEWLYYKIYTGVKTADHILLERLSPIIISLEKKKKIQKWFFVRYKDTEDHIRLRFLLDDVNDLSVIINAFHSVFKELMDEHLIWKIQTDTYQREIERYGLESMGFSEFLFWKDSSMILSYLGVKNSFDKKEMPLFFSFLAIDSFLNDFNLSVTDKLALMNNLQAAFKKEFEIGKKQKKEMDVNYRLFYAEFESFLRISDHKIFQELFYIVNQKSDQVKEISLKIIDKTEVPLSVFLSNHVHMMINRQYSSKQRIYELIIYDHLYRYYKTLVYKKERN